MGNKMIFTFWEGTKPDYIKLCMDTWKFEYVTLNYGNLHKYTELPVDKLKRFTLPQIADCVRVHVLRDNGGYWLDADTIVLDGLPTETILGDPDERTNTIGYLHTEANTDMFNEWAAYQDRIINEQYAPTLWSLMGNDFTDRYLKEHSEVDIGRIGERWAEVDMIGGNLTRMEKYVALYFVHKCHLPDFKKTDILMLHNSWTPQWYKELNEDAVLSADCTLSNILRETL